MTAVPRIRRHLWIALAAFAASLPGTARASGEARCEAMPAGCTAAACHCCEGDGPAVASSAGRAVSIPSAIGSTTDRPSPCVCSSPTPAAPAPRQERRPEEHRSNTGRDVAATDSFEPRPAAPVAIPFAPDVGPPRSPIYLRTARLLI